jgi:hypothetical protein
MLFFINRLSNARSGQKATPLPPGLLVPWLTAAFFAIAIPWLTLLLVYPNTVSDASSIADHWSAIWPILIGAGLVALWLRQGPQPRETDVTAEANFVRRATNTCTSLFERAEAILCQWQVGSISLLAMTLVLTVILATGH